MELLHCDYWYARVVEVDISGTYLSLILKINWNFNQNMKHFSQINAFEIFVCKISTILFRPQCGKVHILGYQRYITPHLLFPVIGFKAATKPTLSLAVPSWAESNMLLTKLHPTALENIDFYSCYILCWIVNGLLPYKLTSGYVQFAVRD